MRKIAIDAADIRILDALQQHGQLSKTKLSEIVNLSPTPCWIRYNRLKEAGLIRGYYADIAHEKIAKSTTIVVTISLNVHRKSNFDRFENHIKQIGEIVECSATGGGMDYVMKVMTPSLSDFQHIMDNLLSAELGIDRYMTYIETRKIKSSQVNLNILMTGSDNQS
ncbi:Lrp/AsnC family transcriptional regulator [Halomonas sp. MCCC 1A17488]|uniref:Lrp/AsnC family transcriptional regulator n=1 Tax=unclassified Halomonas TaxID=2609666 RepID=UPI0018D21436|nr:MULTISPECIES: Lrp/AsnC family transcriptional regulator [unclassified Halomonas]MCE8017723.1 Lrp/AsnC family transcriptional regulator [Halomonas sp. MCCC 1A17488]MCG3241056.1 Lrp/AsnC family transcriptional regulator [Halomonas sp. MCCC 1A17488]QPP48919.1 Lrp/AsnC family transcriptional regulator [Halomonas sp. SS10-MC5]